MMFKISQNLQFIQRDEHKRLEKYRPESQRSHDLKSSIKFLYK